MIKSRIFKLSILILFLILILSPKIYALGTWMSEAEGFIDDGKKKTEEGSTLDTTELKNGSDTIFNALLAIGTVVAVIVGAILGIQFMVSGIEKKVEIKRALFPYIISCTILFGALGIWKFIIEIMKNITK